MQGMEQVTPFLWFDKAAEDAANYYVEVFSKFGSATLGQTVRYDAAAAKASGQPEGSVLTVEFMLNGQHFTALNGGPIMKFSGAVSFVITCDTQEEIDHYWDKLSAGGE